MDESEAPEAADISDPAQKRACDQCRTRKIRCDKESPCSNCRTARRTCSSTGAGQKPKEARQRVLISTQYERKIDQIEDRLGSIEELLRDLAAARLTAPNEAHSSRSHSHTHSQPHASATPSVTAATTFTPTHATGTPNTTTYDNFEPNPDESAFEGQSSLAAHTIFASEFLENAVSRTSLRDLNPSVSSSLSALQQMVNWQNKASVVGESRFPQQRPMPPGGLRELPMPPIDVVITLLRECKETLKSAFSMGIAILGVREFKEYCRRVYFPTEEYSICTFIVVSAGLYYLFCDKAALKSTGSDNKYEEYANLCLDSFETAMAALPLFLPATDENIMALIIGATRAVELNKPSIVWHMVSTALQMCQILGYHRAATYTRSHQPARPKGRMLFWLGYILERGVALGLGRASVIQDWDITVSRDVGDMGVAWEPIRAMMNTWMKHAEIQGNIYRKLYSPAALDQPQEQRILAARQLAQQIELLAAHHQELMKQMDFDGDFGGGGLAEGASASAKADEEFDGLMMKTMIQADQVSYCSTLTLIYRAIPPAGTFGGTLHLECIQTARESIRLHQECMRVLQDSSMLASTYLHWTILFCPFIPFVVLFCHIIETGECGDDLRRLSGFIQSLHGVKTRSDGVEKLQKLCQILHNIATLYVEARQESQVGVGVGVGAVSLGNEVDMYLNQLGLMPGEMPVEGQYPNAGLDNSVAAGQNFQTAHLGDWFSGNRYMMGLLEEENFMNWTAAPQ